MPFEVSEITSFEDFKSVQEALMGGFADPYFPYWELLKGPTEDGCMTTLWHAKEAMPNSHWIKVWDPSTGEVAGAANWLINESDPYENIVMVPRAGWWPAGQFHAHVYCLVRAEASQMTIDAISRTRCCSNSTSHGQRDRTGPTFVNQTYPQIQDKQEELTGR